MKCAFIKNLRTFVFAGILVFFSPFCIHAQTNHVVQKGETLYSISKKYNVSVQAISDANKISGTDIKVGQTLSIPVDTSAKKEEKNQTSAEKTVKTDTSSNSSKSTDEYTVKKGDTWYAIARAYSVNVKTLYELNGTDGTEGLKVGQKVKVPATTKNSVQTSTVVKANDKESSANSQKTNSSKTANPPVIVDTHSYSGKKGDPNLVWPVEKPEVTYVNGKVSGVTLSAKKDEKVEAIKSGTVMFSGSYRGFGNVVFIQSKTGHIYAYTGLGKVLVSKGEYVDFKTQIGTAGIDSYSSKSQISLMVFQNGLPIDPAKAPRG